MTLAFGVLLTASLILALVVNPTCVVPAFVSGCKDSVTFSLTMFAVYALWIPVNKMIEEIGCTKYLSKLLLPVEKRIFPGESSDVYDALSVNISANLLGVGGASTPMGLKAMGNMRKRKNRIMLVVINATSIQLIPTTILTVRMGLNATKDIILPTLAVTALTTIIAVILVKIFVKE